MHLAPDSRIGILLVDDDLVDRKAVVRFLADARLHADITEAETADEAERLANNAFDCVLLDFRLPGADGLQVLRALRDRGITTPVIVLTGHGDEETAVQIMKAGAADYLAKGTLSAERLTRAVVSAVRIRNAEREAAQAKKKLDEVEERYRFLAELIPQMVWIVARDGRVEYVNRRWIEYTGVDLTADDGSGWQAVVHPDDLASATAAWRDAVERGAPFEAQMRMRRRSDGAYRWQLSRGSLMSAAGGRLAWFGTTTDIEDQKRSEAELARLATEAFAARAQAEEANRAKDLFLATLSHELRTPLNAILGWVSILKQRELADDARRRAIDIVDRNARTQTKLIEDLLDVSRIVTGKLRIDSTPVDVRAVLQAAVDTVRPSADVKRIACGVQLDDTPMIVNGDAARLQQIAWNLLINAVKFTPAGGSVALSARARDAQVEVVVEDSGEGIAPAVLPFVFDRFRQADGSSTRSGGGLGLGLAIVRSLVEMHGGSVQAASAGPGAGSRFTVTLPRAIDAAPTGALSEPPRDDVSVAGLRVLVVDDHADGREMLAASLLARGMVVRTASNAEEARARLADALPDVIVSDIAMPLEDGYLFVAELRKRPPEHGGRVPAIALTGYAGLEDQRRARESGFDGHASKPVDIDALVKAIARLAAASRRKAARAGERATLETQ